MSSWYAVYTRPRCEKKVAESLSRKKFEAYCPFNSTPRLWLGRRATPVPLFNSLVFVRMNEAQVGEVRAIDGVINLMYWLGKPAIVRDIEIEMIMRFLKEHDGVRLERMPIDPKAIVRITREAAGDLVDGAKTSKQKIVKLILPTLGYTLVSVSKMEEVNVIVQNTETHHPEYPYHYTS